MVTTTNKSHHVNAFHLKFGDFL